MNFKSCLVIFLAMLSARSVSSQDIQECTISETDNSLVAIFTKIFMYSLAAYQPWDMSLNVDTPVDEITQIEYDICYNYGLELGFSEEESEEVANEVSQAMSDTYGDLTPCGYGEVYGISVGNFLIDYGDLTNENAVYTAWLFSNTTRDCMISGEYDNVEYCLSEGYVEATQAAFLSSNQPFTVLGQYFSDALYQVSNALTDGSESETETKK